MNVAALLYGMGLMLYGIQDFKVPHNCYDLDHAIESIAYGQFVTIHHNRAAYNELHNLLEEKYRILDCDSKLLENKSKYDFRRKNHIDAFNEYCNSHYHYEHCPEINSYLEEHQNIDFNQLSSLEQKTLSEMQTMHQ